MTPKEYFEQVFELEKKVQSKVNERDAIMGTLTGATVMQDDVSFSNQFHSKTESAALKLMEYSDQVNEYVDKLVDLRIQIARELDCLKDDRYRIILRERYLCSKLWEEIAVEQNYAYGSVIRLHGEALIKFESEMNKRLKEDSPFKK